MSEANEHIDATVGSPWISILLALLFGTPILIYGIWCLHMGKAYVPTRTSSLKTFHGVAAYLFAASDISFACMFFSMVIFYRLRKTFNLIVSGLLILSFVLSALGFFYVDVLKHKLSDNTLPNVSNTSPTTFNPEPNMPGSTQVTPMNSWMAKTSGYCCRRATKVGIETR